MKKLFAVLLALALLLGCVPVLADGEAGEATQKAAKSSIMTLVLWNLNI